MSTPSTATSPSRGSRSPCRPATAGTERHGPPARRTSPPLAGRCSPRTAALAAGRNRCGTAPTAAAPPRRPSRRGRPTPVAPSARSPTCPRWPACRARRSTTPTDGDPGWEDFGGTSLASPIIASVYALAYPDSPISSTYANHSSLFDVTSGSNGSCGGSYLCTGVSGYDGPTGLGTPCGTAGFGTGPFVTPGCSSLAPTPSAQPLTSKPSSTPTLVFTPACTVAQPGYARCDAQRITKH